MVDHKKAYDTMNNIARSTIAVIDTVTQRGGFRGEELTTIGQLRDQATNAVQIVENWKQEQSDEKPEKK